MIISELVHRDKKIKDKGEGGPKAEGGEGVRAVECANKVIAVDKYQVAPRGNGTTAAWP